MFTRNRPQPKIKNNDGTVRIYDYGVYLPLWKRPKRALLSYLVEPVAAELNGATLNRFSNHGLAVSWARVLNELGYIVDIINWDDTNFNPTESYDLVVLHGAKNYESLKAKLLQQPPIIYFATGTHWKFSNAQEDARLADVYKRHGVHLPRDRFVAETEDIATDAAKGIIALGNNFIQNTYRKHHPLVMGVNNASYPDNHFDKVPKDYAQIGNNFLFFAGAGNVHKGLDLLLDSFKDLPDQHLYIVTVKEPAFHKAFKRELALPNIHWIGEVNMRTKEFYDALDRCAFIIFPSCSEGQAGSVVEAMNQGLIPIVSKETSLDTEPYGLVLADNSIPTIQAAIKTMARKSPNELAQMAQKVRHVAQTEHSPERFRRDLHRAVKQILAS